MKVILIPEIKTAVWKGSDLVVSRLWRISNSMINKCHQQGIKKRAGKNTSPEH